MTRKFFSLMASVAVLLTACDFVDDVKDELDDPVDEDVEEPGNVHDRFVDRNATVVMQNTNIVGTVRDTDGKPLQDVTVWTGQASVASQAPVNVKTDENGSFSLTKVGVANDRAIIRFEKDGYFKVTRSAEFQDEQVMNVVLQKKGNSSNSASKDFKTNNGTSLSAGGMKVEIGKNAVAYNVDGSEYDGKVNIDMLYLSPDNKNFGDLMPGGDLAALRTDDSNAQLVSYGMFQVSMTGEDGDDLQLSETATSTVRFPIPESMKNNPPETMPLWHFSENLGIWIEDGEAVLDGNEYVGEVTHFSWWNCDKPENTAYLSILVVDCNNTPIANQQVTIDQRKFTTNRSGIATMPIPVGDKLEAYVAPEDYFDYNDVKTFNVTTTEAGSKQNITITLPCQNRLTAKVVNSCAENTAMTVYAFTKYQNSKGQYTTPLTMSNDKGEISIVIGKDATEGTLTIITQANERKTVSFTANGQDLDLGTIDFCANPNQNPNGNGEGAPTEGCASIFANSPYGYTESAYTAITKSVWFFMDTYNLYNIDYAWDKSILPECFPDEPENVIKETGYEANYYSSTWYKCMTTPVSEHEIFSFGKIYFPDDYYYYYATTFAGPIDVRDNILKQLENKGFFLQKDKDFDTILADIESKTYYKDVYDHAYSKDYYFALRSHYNWASDNGVWSYDLLCVPKQITLPKSFEGIPIPQFGMPEDVWGYTQYSKDADGKPNELLEEDGNINEKPQALWYFRDETIHLVSQQEFDSYLKELEDSGFKQSRKNEGHSDYDASDYIDYELDNGNIYLQVSYYADIKELRVCGANHSYLTEAWSW
ncbi:MAG: carboxypeptidase regulatory-like domain-containing protein [Bacteroidales bacterium]|nr:carboxypeptidase regulatory-like domain-containing protein [Bacteroidales bacterium]